MHVSMIRHRVAAIVAALYVLYGTPGALAQTQATRPTAVEETPPQVHALLKLLDDPAVRQWLERQRAADSATFPAAAPPPAAATTPIAAADNMVLDYFVTRITAIRHHIGELVATLPDLTTDFDRAFLILYLEFRDRGLIELLLLVAAFAALGFGTEWLFVRLTAPARARIGELPLGRVSERLRAMVMRLAFTVGQLTVFAIGSIGAFLVFDWPPLLRKIVLGYLVAFLAFRIALVTGRFVLAPPDKLFRGNERFRILPMTREAAWFWDRRLALLVGWFVFGWVTVELLSTLGFAPAARKLVAYALGVGLLVFGIEIAWRRPAFATSTETAAAAPRTVWGALAAYSLFRGVMAALGRRSDSTALAFHCGGGASRGDADDATSDQSHPAPAGRGRRRRDSRRAYSLPRTRHPRRAYHWRRLAVGVGLAYRPGRDGQPGFTGHPSATWRAQHRRHRTRRRFRLACGEGADRSQAD